MDFLDKLLEKIPYDKLIPMPFIQRRLALGAILIVVGIVFYMFVIQGKDQEIELKRQELSKISNEVAALQSYAQKKDKLRRQLEKLEANLEEAKKVLPSEKEIPTLLQQISDFGLQAGLDFQKFTPRGEVQKTEYYSEVPVDIEVRGKFHNVLLFFDDIAHLPRIVTIGNVSMQAGKDKDASDLSVKLQAVTYRFIETAVSGKPAAAPDAAKAGNKG